MDNEKKSSKKGVIIGVVVVLLIGAGIGVYFLTKGEKNNESTT